MVAAKCNARLGGAGNAAWLGAEPQSRVMAGPQLGAGLRLFIAFEAGRIGSYLDNHLLNLLTFLSLPPALFSPVSDPCLYVIFKTMDIWDGDAMSRHADESIYSQRGMNKDLCGMCCVTANSSVLLDSLFRADEGQ